MWFCCCCCCCYNHIKKCGTLNRFFHPWNWKGPVFDVQFFATDHQISSDHYIDSYVKCESRTIIWAYLISNTHKKLKNTREAKWLYKLGCNPVNKIWKQKRINSEYIPFESKEQKNSEYIIKTNGMRSPISECSTCVMIQFWSKQFYEKDENQLCQSKKAWKVKKKIYARVDSSTVIHDFRPSVVPKYQRRKKGREMAHYYV